MSTEETKSPESTKEKGFVLTDELREKASQKPEFKILYINDGESYLTPFRGEPVLRSFSEFYAKQANIEYMTASSSKLSKMTKDDFKDINILWLDNTVDFATAHNLAGIHTEMLTDIDPDWKDTVAKLEEEDMDKAIEYVAKIGAQRANKLRVIYALDEFIWEAPVGRKHDIQSAQIKETFMNIADVVVVPTRELKDMINYISDQARSMNVRPLILDQEKQIRVIPTALNATMCPVYKNFIRDNRSMTDRAMTKPKVLIKGIYIPQNVQQFIHDNYKKMDITLCSVAQVDGYIMGLAETGQVSTLHHWANPDVNKNTLYPTYSLERDAGFDFVLHTLPDSLDGNAYQITIGFEDILFAISYGALPICGYDHIIPNDVDDDERKEMTSNMVPFTAGLTFGKDTTAKALRSMVERHKIGVTWNEAYAKYKALLNTRVIESSNALEIYFVTMLGEDMYNARNALATEKRIEMEKEANLEAKAKEDELIERSTKKPTKRKKKAKTTPTSED